MSHALQIYYFLVFSIGAQLCGNDHDSGASSVHDCLHCKGMEQEDHRIHTEGSYNWIELFCQDLQTHLRCSQLFLLLLLYCLLYQDTFVFTSKLLGVLYQITINSLFLKGVSIQQSRVYFQEGANTFDHKPQLIRTEK